MSNYTGPGVDIKEVANANPNTVQSGPRRLGIAGKGSSTIKVENIEVLKGVAGGTDTITGYTAAQVSSVVGVGSRPGLYDYKLTTDYTVTDNTIVWSPSGAEPATDSIYYVTIMKVKDSSYYEPMNLTSLDDVRAIFGSELDNGVVGEITLAAKMAFNNGAQEVLCVQQTADTTAAAEAAIDKLETEDLDVLVAPGMCTTTLQNYIFGHCQRMSSETEKKDRIYIAGPTTLEATVEDIRNAAIGFRNDIVTLIAPAKIDVVLTDATCMTDITTTVSSAYAGAAIAGIICNPSYDEAEPITRKNLVSIEDFNGVKYKNSEMNDLGSNGVTVLENINGTIRVRHALTTSIANVNEKELQVKIIRNQQKKDLRTLFEPYIGTKYITNYTNALLSSALDGFCKQKVNDNVYVEYKDISVRQSSLDPRIALISYSFKPVFTLTWIRTTFSLYF